MTSRTSSNYPASAVDLPGQQEIFERANEIERDGILPVMSPADVRNVVQPIDSTKYDEGGFVSEQDGALDLREFEGIDDVVLYDQGEAMGWGPYNRVVRLVVQGEFYGYCLARVL